MRRLFSDEELAFADCVGRVNRANPFLPERIEWERKALGAEFAEAAADWNVQSHAKTLPNPNLSRLLERACVLTERIRTDWPRNGRVTRAEGEAHVALVAFRIFHAFAERFDGLIREGEARRARGGGEPPGRVRFFAEARAEMERLLAVPGLRLIGETGAVEHFFALAFQMRRAFFHIFGALAGGSAPMARLRAAIWQSIFTHDFTRYRRTLFSRMGDFATLVIGPSGTGKELVARAIALSRYVAFDSKRGMFAEDFAGAFFPLNLSALSPTLIESELFGHRRGAFTGALADRAGWMEVCPAAGAVFLDEIGDVDAGIQVKLLRVLQARTFQRLGDTESRVFQGKVIAATNRDLPAEIRAGRFREDFYYRLCSDVVRTPSLREQLDGAGAGELASLAEHAARRLVGAGEAEAFAREAVAWMTKNLGADYAWPGNFRELEQCMRNLLVRGEYRPAGPLAGGAADDWNALIGGGRLTAEELLRRYTRLVHAQAGTVEETARRLDLDRRTVKARLG
ncbi:sigma 54-interacting transcriptional regulator [Termitidicoccus mucosus]|uniref:Histidine kinase n=1 Tax=Termitidicoccus mucosus TaxID=1184151 RepID=A0A178IIZ0_9BACT|nr:histidine kinase [Opitutaceae bacterium TSB47]